MGKEANGVPEQKQKPNDFRASQRNGAHSSSKKPVILGQKPTKARRAPTLRPASPVSLPQEKPKPQRKYTEAEIAALKKRYKEEQKAERERIRRKKRVENYRRRMQWKKDKKGYYQRLLFGSVIGGFFYLVLLALGIAGFNLYLSAGKGAVDASLRIGVEYPVGGSEELTVIYDLPIERDDVTYLPVDILEKLSGITITGDYDVYSVILKNGEIARFALNHDSCELNGNKTLLSGKCFLSDGNLYLPSDFYETNLNGFETFYSQDGKTLTFLKGDADFSFSFKACFPEEPIPYDDSLIPVTE